VAWFLAAVFCLCVVLVLVELLPTGRTPSKAVVGAASPAAGDLATPASYIGAGACRECHQDQFKAWTGSHHDLAMQVASSSTVLGDFNNAEVEHFGAKTTFFRRDNQFMVRTDGPDGQMSDYEVAYTFGVAPLQQYLVAFPGGRYQALPVAWDTRPVAEGGQKWFHLYPNEKIDHTDQLHWTGLYQNWNLMCAECHSTNLHKGYDPATNSYHTTFSEINVACESCHGPGSKHVQWARQAHRSYQEGADNGLQAKLDSRWSGAWRLESSEAHFPVRDTPASPATLNVCAACHARRSTIAEDGAPGASIEDAHRLALLTDPLYHTDGQQREEVYTWGSFLQSRMYQRGVTCMDCHDPHSLHVRAEGNALCARCHSPAIFDTPKHHFHQQDSPGARCTACHMPSQKYMVVHERLDHSIRVPRPDLSAVTGAPNACTMCHTDRTSSWAASAMDQWYPPTWRQRPQWGPTLAAANTQGAKALPALLGMARNVAMPAIVRATAAELAGPSIRPESLPDIRALIGDADPLVRVAAIGLLDEFDADARASAAGACLSDPVRGVRIAAARLLADVSPDLLPAGQAGALDRANRDLESSLRLNSDWPAENVNAGDLALRRGRFEEAIASYQRAIALDPRFAASYVNLADVYRQLGRDSEGEQELRTGLTVLPRSADLHHALGLLLVRKGDKPGGLSELASAASLAPENTRYAYVYAIGLHSAGNAAAALQTLRQADTRHPYDPGILSALVSILRERNAAGDLQEALACARRLAEALPGDAGVKQLVEELSGR
jgi:Flp pilus assembly protein TadD